MTSPLHPSPASAKSDQERPDTSLARRYGEIGIPAVAAALRYQGPIRNNPKGQAPAGKRDGKVRAA